MLYHVVCSTLLLASTVSGFALARHHPNHHTTPKLGRHNYSSYDILATNHKSPTEIEQHHQKEKQRHQGHGKHRHNDCSDHSHHGTFLPHRSKHDREGYKHPIINGTEVVQYCKDSTIPAGIRACRNSIEPRINLDGIPWKSCYGFEPLYWGVEWTNYNLPNCTYRPNPQVWPNAWTAPWFPRRRFRYLEKQPEGSATLKVIWQARAKPVLNEPAAYLPAPDYNILEYESKIGTKRYEKVAIRHVEHDCKRLKHGSMRHVHRHKYCGGAPFTNHNMKYQDYTSFWNPISSHPGRWATSTFNPWALDPIEHATDRERTIWFNVGGTKILGFVQSKTDRNDFRLDDWHYDPTYPQLTSDGRWSRRFERQDIMCSIRVSPQERMDWCSNLMINPNGTLASRLARNSTRVGLSAIQENSWPRNITTESVRGITMVEIPFIPEPTPAKLLGKHEHYVPYTRPANYHRPKHPGSQGHIMPLYPEGKPVLQGYPTEGSIEANNEGERFIDIVPIIIDRHSVSTRAVASTATTTAGPKKLERREFPPSDLRGHGCYGAHSGFFGFQKMWSKVQDCPPMPRPLTWTNTTLGHPTRPTSLELHRQHKHEQARLAKLERIKAKHDRKARKAAEKLEHARARAAKRAMEAQVRAEREMAQAKRLQDELVRNERERVELSAKRPLFEAEAREKREKDRVCPKKFIHSAAYDAGCPGVQEAPEPVGSRGPLGDRV